MDYLFERKPEYDENGQIVSHTTPKIVWVIAAAALFYCFRGKLTGQKGGALNLQNLPKFSGKQWLLVAAVAVGIAFIVPTYWYIAFFLAWFIVKKLTDLQGGESSRSGV
jgi:hypothetical protein